MKINLHHIILFASTLSVLVLLPAITFAQDAEHKFSRDYSTPSTPPEMGNNDELYNMTDEDRSPVRTNPASSYLAKDSLVSKSNVNAVHRGRNNNDHRNVGENLKNSDKQKEDKDESDSILSFNFIYYIFQKFKLSDIVDDK